MPQDPDGLIPGRVGHFVELEPDDIQLRLAALDFALRYPPSVGDVIAPDVVARATAFLAFLQGNSGSNPDDGFNTGDESRGKAHNDYLGPFAK
jgi:hypothetical protein